MNKITKKRIGIVIGIAVLVLIGIIIFLRIRNLRKQLESEPVQEGESYERFDEKKANDVIVRYFDGMAAKDIDSLKDIFYSKDVLATFAKVNNMTEDAIIDSLKTDLESVTLQYKELTLEEHSAYREADVSDVNAKIKESIGVSDVIQDMYAVSIKFMQYTDDDWEEKTDTIRVYVVNGEYRIWPRTEEE